MFNYYNMFNYFKFLVYIQMENKYLLKKKRLKNVNIEI